MKTNTATSKIEYKHYSIMVDDCTTGGFVVSIDGLGLYSMFNATGYFEGITEAKHRIDELLKQHSATQDSNMFDRAVNWVAGRVFFKL